MVDVIYFCASGVNAVQVLFHQCIHNRYRVTIHLVQNLPLTSKQKFHFGLACPDLARPKRNFSFEVNGRFCKR